MKAYTDIEQSKRLAKILPRESADMYYLRDIYYPDAPITAPRIGSPVGIHTPCWSLTALLSVLPEPILTQFSEDKWNVAIFGKDNHFKEECFAGEPVDACYTLILKLKAMEDKI